MTRRVYIALAAGIVACVTLLSFVVVGVKLTGEDWCSDRSPWWGPPTDPTSTCSGLSWASRHPGEYPQTMPN